MTTGMTAGMNPGIKSLLILASLPLCLSLLACSEEAPLPPPESRPVKTMLIGGLAAGDQRQFPGVVDAIQKAEISFRVRGKLNTLPAKEGENVKQGQVLATLDPRDYQIVLNDRKASYDTAKANYDRAKELLEKNAISRVDHDNIRAKYHTAKANLDAAEQDLSYTTLRAKFDGFVAKRYVENFEEVFPRQAVLLLQDVSELEIKIDIPETIMIMLRKHKDTAKSETREPKRSVYAVFDQIKGQKFPLALKEIATKADVNTRTFQATLKMKNPEGYNVLPGMTATVFAEVFPGETGGDEAIELPLSAVVSSTDKQSTVWLVDEDTMTVSPVPVKLVLLTKEAVTVTGLNPGQRVVTAGASFLREGMQVTLLETGEQPE
jgi:RND family efflux transporter MFP subunit